MVEGSSKHPEEWARPRTVIVLTLLFLATLWAAVSFWVVSARDERIAATVESLRRMNHAVADQTQRQFRLVNVFLGSCANWLEANPGRDPRSDPGFQRLIEDFRRKTGEAIAIRLLAADGGVFDVLSATSVPLANVADRDYFKGTPSGGGLLIGSPERSRPDGPFGLPIAMRLATPGHAFPILLAVVDLSSLNTVYEKQRRKPDGVITLLRSDGTLLASAPEDPSLLGQPIADLSLAGAEVMQQTPLLVREETTGKQGRRFTSYSPVPDFPLLVSVSANYDEVLAPWWKQTLWLLLLAIGVTVPLAVIAFRSLRLLHALASRDAELQYLAATDRLTGVSSRQHFVQATERQLQRASSEHTPLAILLFDIDFFKRINDGYGHAVGDQVLISFAEVASGCLRGMDVIGRLGGGEFTMLLLDTDIKEAIVVADRIRQAIAEISIPTENGTVQFTVSVGACEACATDSSFDTVLKRAAEALHGARVDGPDHLVVG